ncbi:hypothetical protein MHSWG343_00310 [Candidatus Mycoplasma haematohominis]|uniref:Uncharacterized protein n=1 Tax=Candidatus Mycoplasma haematohominis TaxID=1494318 RepID=A0A478FP50_9MOLU|nr:hypothetical protein MHSWG343_00310 [Candidatus Mycoplasma haemohominis]
MASPAAVGGGLLGAGAIGVGSAYLAGAFEGADSSKVEVEPANVLLSHNGTPSTYTSDTVGKLYENYLVSPVDSKESGGTTINNQKWWEWSYKRWQADSGKENNNLSVEFKNSQKINSPFSGITVTEDSPKALNQVCEAVYKQNKSTIITLESSPDNPTKLKRDLFKYCSILGEVKTISEAGENYDNKKGGDSTNKKTFISVTGNDKFWKIRNEEFYADGNGAKSKSKATGESSKFKVKSAETDKPEIRKICEGAYESTKEEQTNYPIADVNIFCVL